ncbi:MAG: glutathione S-transferase family protein [Ketobacteraceae bacterium]|nr:glutathione S-transferase family protein [Ketobacteraceae bacterium]
MISRETPLILHHYPMSPFSEKIRAMLGYLEMEWQSALTTEMPPRPVLQTLAGGYRKIPVAQIGADVFCDTRTITPLLAEFAGQPQLTLENCSEDIRRFVEKVEGKIFFACVMYASGLKLNTKVLKSLSIWQIIRLMVDRVKMTRNAIVAMPSFGQASGLVSSYFEEMESMLTGDFLFGDQPTIADFSAYHSLWFVREMGEKPAIRRYPAVNAWMDRIKAFGQGSPADIPGTKAIEAARFSEPAPLPVNAQPHDLTGELVRIAPADYALDPTVGVLRACTDNTYIIARNDPDTGDVHVHFPREGFILGRAD